MDIFGTFFASEIALLFSKKNVMVNARLVKVFGSQKNLAGGVQAVVSSQPLGDGGKQSIDQCVQDVA
jgi:hypothetical protein